VADELKRLVDALVAAHGGNLKSVVLYGGAVVGGLDDETTCRRKSSSCSIRSRLLIYSRRIRSPNSGGRKAIRCRSTFTTEEIADCG